MAFSPRNIVGCLLKKRLSKGGGVTDTPGPPSLRPWLGSVYFTSCHITRNRFKIKVTCSLCCLRKHFNFWSTNSTRLSWLTYWNREQCSKIAWNTIFFNYLDCMICQFASWNKIWTTVETNTKKILYLKSSVFNRKRFSVSKALCEWCLYMYMYFEFLNFFNVTLTLSFYLNLSIYVQHPLLRNLSLFPVAWITSYCNGILPSHLRTTLLKCGTVTRWSGKIQVVETVLLLDIVLSQLPEPLWLS